MKKNKEITLKLTEEEKKLLLELLKVEKGKYEVVLHDANKKPKEYGLLEKLLLVLQQSAAVA